MPPLQLLHFPRKRFDRHDLDHLQAFPILHFGDFHVPNYRFLHHQTYQGLLSTYQLLRQLHPPIHREYPHEQSVENQPSTSDLHS